MNAIFLNSEHRKSSNPHILIFKHTDKLDSRRGGKSIVLSSLSIQCTWENIKSSCNNEKFKISTPTWKDTFKLPDGSYSVSDIQH